MPKGGEEGEGKKGQRTVDKWTEWVVRRDVAEMKSLHWIIYREEWEEDAVRMEMKRMSGWFRDVQQRGEGR